MKAAAIDVKVELPGRPITVAVVKAELLCRNQQGDYSAD